MRAVLVAAIAAALVAGSAGTAHADEPECTPPVVTVAPGLQASYAVGEVGAGHHVVAHWSCHTLDTGVVYTISGTLIAYVEYGGVWREYDRESMHSSTTAGIAAVYFAWSPDGRHLGSARRYVRFVGSPSNGAPVTYSTPPYYVGSL